LIFSTIRGHITVTKKVQKWVNKWKNCPVEQHIIALTELKELAIANGEKI
jgi:hypothetical protein